MPDPLPVLCLAGPTGAGKTALALRLAEKLEGEIVNADSRQVYADFPIITAQPTESEKRAVPHNLYGFLPLTQRIDAGQWRSLALAECARIAARGRVPLLVGGTGFYFKSILTGLADIPPVDKSISAALELRMAAEGPEPLHAELAAIDPAYAAKAHPHDRQRIQRALEVWQATGKTFTWWHVHSKSRPLATGPLLVVAMTLEELEPRLKHRIGLMLEAGALEEARRALLSHPHGAHPGWSGIGCAELLRYLRHEMDMEECKRLWLANTRAYAKRQLTWFRGEKQAIWIDGARPDKVLDELRKHI